MIIDDVRQRLQSIVCMPHVKILERGNAAIKTAVSLSSKKVLIPEEGGWLTYTKYHEYGYVQCTDAVINLDALRTKLATGEFDMVLYHNPGGYFAVQPCKDIYDICSEFGVMVAMDISGSLGTDLYNPDYADIVIGSFGRWKLADAQGGGFIASRDVIDSVPLEYSDEDQLAIILEKLDELRERIVYLLERRNKVVTDLSKDFRVLRPNDPGFVVVVAYSSDTEKEQLIFYCNTHNLEYTECPRYIRVMKKAISIEVKRL
jgi:hypothetical protein